MSRESHLEAALRLQIEEAGLPAPEQEVRFAKPRMWRFDFYWPDRSLAVEVEGGTWAKKGRHTTGAGFAADCSKYNAAALQGITVLRFTGDMIKTGEAVRLIRRAIEGGDDARG